MLRHSTISPARRRAVLTSLSLAACIVLPVEAPAATARVRWLPRGHVSLSRYDVYVRDAGATHRPTPVWSGNPPPAADGALEAVVSFTPASAGANYFAVVAANGSTESPLSGEVATGTPIPCRSDRCTTKTSCDFSDIPDGTSCDPGAGDPCLAACLAGACEAGSGQGGSGAEVDIDRLRFTTRASSIKLTLKATFAGDATVDPASTGAVVELRASDGTVVYSAAVAASSFALKKAGRRFHFRARRTNADPLWNGLANLDFRSNGSEWIVSGLAKGPAFATAALEPALTLVVRLGATCVRHLDAACEQKETVALCR
jgi:hypothetical protein